MGGDSVVDLEREVEEFLLSWSSSTPTDDDILPQDSAPPITAQREDTSNRTEVIAERVASDPSRVSMEQQGRRRDLHRSEGLRHIRRDCHPYKDGGLGRRRPTPQQTYHDSYVAELKATWPARYRKLKESMDRIWKRR